MLLHPFYVTRSYQFDIHNLCDIFADDRSLRTVLVITFKAIKMT